MPVPSRSRLRRALAAGASLVVAGNAIVSVFTGTLRAARPLSFQPGNDCATRHIARFERIRPLVPSRGVIGYVGPAFVEESCDVLMAAQHALAPVLLVNLEDGDMIQRVQRVDLVAPPRLPLAIVDLSAPGARAWLQSQREYRIVAAPGDNIVLIAASE
jgi:hypothetical protein